MHVCKGAPRSGSGRQLHDAATAPVGRTQPPLPTSAASAAWRTASASAALTLEAAHIMFSAAAEIRRHHLVRFVDGMRFAGVHGPFDWNRYGQYSALHGMAVDLEFAALCVFLFVVVL